MHELGHNCHRSLAAGIVGNQFNFRKEQTREAFSDFQAQEHRLETVIKIRGVEFIDDSRATNVNAAWFALESMSKPVIWIAGGIDKGNDYRDLALLVRKKVRAIICLGADNTRLHAAFRTMDVMINVHNMGDAVRCAYQLARPGDCVLLSPACASFDLFENWEDRGKKFKDAVCAL